MSYKLVEGDKNMYINIKGRDISKVERKAENLPVFLFLSLDIQS